MTSDAKIGLLLGLVFIFLIAFVINGLPSFNQKTANSELTMNMVSLSDKSPGIGTKERRVTEALRASEMTKKQELPIGPAVEPNQKAEQTLASLPAGNLVATAPAAAETKELPPEPKPIAAESAEEQQTYVVAQGDSLVSIAKKFYGEKDGKKQANIMMIFESNKSELKSPKDLKVGQKIVIPQLAKQTDTDQLLSHPLLEKTDSVGKRHEVSEKPKTNTASSSTKDYTVKANDTLWKIAAEQLGNPSRYKEIIKLNSELFKNKESVTAGMKLKLPAK